MKREVSIRNGRLYYSWGWPAGGEGSFLNYVEMSGDIDRAIGAMNSMLPKSCPPVTKEELFNG